MTGMSLQRCCTNKIRFRMRCCQTVGLNCNNQLKTNAFSYGGNWNMVYLDRQVVQCNNQATQPFSSLRLFGSGKNLTYQYNCCRNSLPVRCRNVHTPFNDDGRGNAVYLDRHNVQCHDNEFLTRLHLVRSPPRVRYNYKCCRLNG